MSWFDLTFIKLLVKICVGPSLIYSLCRGWELYKCVGMGAEGTSTCRHVEARGKHQVTHPITLCHILCLGPLTKPGARLPALLLTSLELREYSATHIQVYSFTWVLGIQAEVLKLEHQASLPTEAHPPPRLCVSHVTSSKCFVKAAATFIGSPGMEMRQVACQASCMMAPIPQAVRDPRSRAGYFVLGRQFFIWHDAEFWLLGSLQELVK